MLPETATANREVDKQTVIDATRRWISSMVIGLNLCPFAQRVFRADLIRYVVSDAEDKEALLEELARELKMLAGTPISQVETTLLIHPRVFAHFLDYNEFLADADRWVKKQSLQGIIQIASFHPDYQFAGAEVDAVENYTNRSPYPMLHLLREASIDNVADDQDELLDIPRRNIETLRRLGKADIVRRLLEGGWSLRNPGSEDSTHPTR